MRRCRREDGLGLAKLAVSLFEAVQETLVQADYEVERLGIGRDVSRLVSDIQERRPDVVFNLFEGFGDQYDTEPTVPLLLDWLHIPFTGSPPQALTLAKNKALTKFVLRGAGLPTADFFVVHELPVPVSPLAWPVIVKPALQDASVGIDQQSVVTDQKQLEARVAHCLRLYGGPILVERFIFGRELCVGMIEAPALRPLPLSEIQFNKVAAGYWPIVSYEAKWKIGSEEDLVTVLHFPKDVTPELTRQLQTLACQAFRLLGLRDYGRVDFRVELPDRPYILEVNPNSDFGPDVGLANGLSEAGLSHAWFTVELVKNALARGRGDSLRHLANNLLPV